MPKSNQIPWKKRLQYDFDNFMSKGGLSLFLALMTGFFAAFAIMTIIRSIANFLFPSKNVSTLFGVFIEVINQLTGLSGFNDDPSLLDLIIGLTTILLGLVLFSSLVAFITQQFEAKIESLKQGKSSIIENGHTLILGFDEKLVDIIRELSIANLSMKRATIVILSEQDKPVLDDYLRNYFKNLEIKNTRIVTRSGLISSKVNLKRVGAEYSRSIIILNSSNNTDSEKSKWQGDAQVIKSLLAVNSLLENSVVDELDRPSIVVEMHQNNSCELAQRLDSERISIIREEEILARIQVQASRSIGIAGVYLKLIGFEGSEFYFYSPTSGWDNLKFSQLAFHLPRSLPIGIQYSDGNIELNPDKNYQLKDGDLVIVICEDDSLITFTPQPILVIDPSIPHQVPESHTQEEIERYLLVGWNGKTRISLQEYGKYLSKGSSVLFALIDLTSEILEEFNQIAKIYPEITMEIIELKDYDYKSLEKLHPENFKTVSIFADTEFDEPDTQILTLLLSFKQILKNQEKKKGKKIPTDLIAECVNTDNSDLIVQLGIKDFILSNNIISKITAQVSQEPKLMRVYEELFSEEGNELYLKPVTKYFRDQELQSIKFSDCILRAQVRNELCCGVKLDSKSTQPSDGFSDNIYINPNLDQSFNLTTEDYLIVLSRDE